MAGELLADLFIKNQNRPDLQAELMVGVFQGDTIKLENRITLSSNQFVIPDILKRKVVTCNRPDCSCEVVVQEGLKAGDSVFLLRVRQGKFYYVLSRG